MADLSAGKKIVYRGFPSMSISGKPIPELETWDQPLGAYSLRC
jgi:hypothetical protein